MARQVLYSGRSGAEYTDAWWTTVRRLFNDCFPGLPRGIEAASNIGAQWQSVSTPFVLTEGGRAVAHVGVLVHPMRLAGETIQIAGVHAVCTAPDRRREGLAKAVLTEALAWIDDRFPTAKLHTDEPGIYRGQGFRVLPTHRFQTALGASQPIRKRLLKPSTDPADARLLAAFLRGRTLASNRCASADPGWMVTIVAALNGLLDSAFWLLEDYDAIVAFDQEEGRPLVLDVIAKTLPPLAVVAGAAPDPSLPLLWTFSPDLFSDSVESLPAPGAIGSFMVRGIWPVDEPFGISPLWEH